MGLLSPHRRFRNPDNLEGIPRLRKHGSKARPASTGSGAKVMLTPRDGDLKELLERAVRRDEKPHPIGQLLGRLAVAGVLFFLGFHWYAWRNPDVMDGMGNLFWAIVILSLGVIHLLAVFSQIYSNGRNTLGALSLVILYAGTILLVVIDHLLQQ
jgi:hypothetical protein